MFHFVVSNIFLVTFLPLIAIVCSVAKYLTQHALYLCLFLVSISRLSRRRRQWDGHAPLQYVQSSRVHFGGLGSSSSYIQIPRLRIYAWLYLICADLLDHAHPASIKLLQCRVLPNWGFWIFLCLLHGDWQWTCFECFVVDIQVCWHYCR